MPDNISLRNLINNATAQEFATATGQQMHLKMQGVMIDGGDNRGNPELIAQIQKNPNLAEFFTAKSKTEVPIAGHINGKFISRRIDRLVVDDEHKTVRILDYKTDTDKNTFREKYISQIREYISLTTEIYPNHAISGYILWLHDFSLEKIY